MIRYHKKAMFSWCLSTHWPKELVNAARTYLGLTIQEEEIRLILGIITIVLIVFTYGTSSTTLVYSKFVYSSFICRQRSLLLFDSAHFFPQKLSSVSKCLTKWNSIAQWKMFVYNRETKYWRINIKTLHLWVYV